MSRARRRSTGPPKCSDCHVQILWLRSMATKRWRMFEAGPVNAHTHSGALAYPSEGHWYWRLDELVEDLMIRRDCTRAEAEAEAYDFEWHPVHQCRTTPRPQEPEE